VEQHALNNPLIGTWKLISWETRSNDGQVQYPFGQDATGYLFYTQDGYMSVTIMKAQRGKFAGGDLLGGSVDENAHAAESFLSYCGRYEFNGDSVMHQVELSLFPNWVGVEQMRLAALAGTRLTLSTRPMLVGGMQQTAHLICERV
jgi:hypothetical protein